MASADIILQKSPKKQDDDFKAVGVGPTPFKNFVP